MKKAKWGIYALAVFAAFFIGSCTHTYAPSSGLKTIQIVQFQPAKESVLAGGGGWENLHEESWITSSQGGDVELTYNFFSFHFANTISIPSGALPHDTLVSITVPNAFVAEYYYEPSPMVFNNPVTVTLSYQSPSIDEGWEDLGIYYYDEDEQEWEEIDADIEVSHHELHATFELEHFSRYALGRP